MITDQKTTKKISAILLTGDENDIQIALTKTPNFFRRICMWCFLGWKIKKVVR